MHGCGGYILEQLLRDTSCTVQTIRGNPDPLFGGINPEPMMPQLEPLGEAIRKTGSHVGLATDGDADRLGIVDEAGKYVNTLQTLSLLLLHVYRTKGWRGAVARTVSQSLLIPRITAKFGLELFERPIGFKNIGELMLDRRNFDRGRRERWHRPFAPPAGTGWDFHQFALSRSARSFRKVLHGADSRYVAGVRGVPL